MFIYYMINIFTLYFPFIIYKRYIEFIIELNKDINKDIIILKKLNKDMGILNTQIYFKRFKKVHGISTYIKHLP